MTDTLPTVYEVFRRTYWTVQKSTRRLLDRCAGTSLVEDVQAISAWSKSVAYSTDPEVSYGEVKTHLKSLRRLITRVSPRRKLRVRITLRRLRIHTRNLWRAGQLIREIDGVARLPVVNSMRIQCKPRPVERDIPVDAVVHETAVPVRAEAICDLTSTDLIDCYVALTLGQSTWFPADVDLDAVHTLIHLFNTAYILVESVDRLLSAVGNLRWTRQQPTEMPEEYLVFAQVTWLSHRRDSCHPYWHPVISSMICRNLSWYSRNNLPIPLTHQAWRAELFR